MTTRPGILTPEDLSRLGFETKRGRWARERVQVSRDSRRRCWIVVVNWSGPIAYYDDKFAMTPEKLAAIVQSLPPPYPEYKPRRRCDS